MLKKMSGLDKYIAFSFLMIILYTISAYIIVIATGYRLNTLTKLFFGFFGGEVFACAMIKRLKLKNKAKEREDEEYGRSIDDDT